MGSDYLARLQNIKLNGKPPKENKVYKIPPKSQKKLAKEKEERDARGGDDTELQKWFKSRQKQLTGTCQRCGEQYNKKDFKLAIKSTAHIFEKRENMFPSVKYHPLNFIELSPYCSCHNWFDNYASWQEKLDDEKIGGLLKERFIMIEPSISQEERKHLPDCLTSLIIEPF